MADDLSHQFVDSNILVYAHDRTAGVKRDRALALVQHLWESRQGCVSIQVLQEFYVTVTSKVPRPLSSATTTAIIDDLGTWRVHRPRQEDVLSAIQLKDRYQISFWDAMIVQSAIQLNSSVVWSEDLSSGQVYGPLRAENPFVK